jgi:hypothetical protein
MNMLCRARLIWFVSQHYRPNGGYDQACPAEYSRLFKRTGYFWHDGQYLFISKALSSTRKIAVALDQWVVVVYSTL